jgi:hypothetical protein
MRKPGQETVDFITEILIKVVGESIKDRVARLIFVLIVSVASQFIPTRSEQVCTPIMKDGVQKILIN